jgi:hypothetical protein
VIDIVRMKLYLGIEDTERDDLITLLGDYALEFLERETHRRFGAVEDTVEFRDGSGTSRLWLREPPLGPDSEHTIVVAGRRGAGDWEEVDPAAYEVRGRALIRRDGRQWMRRDEYRIEYARGYEALPLDIEREVFDLVRWKLTDLAERQSGVISEKIGDYSYTLGDVNAVGAGNPWVARLNGTIMRWQDNPL